MKRHSAPQQDAQLSAHDARWTDAACRALDESAAAIDAASLSRLNRARQAALEVARVRRAPAWTWPAAFAAVACCALAVLVWPGLRAPQSDGAENVIAVGDLELLATDDELALYEDLEFYAWLDTQQSAGG